MLAFSDVMSCCSIVPLPCHYLRAAIQTKLSIFRPPSQIKRKKSVRFLKYDKYTRSQISSKRISAASSSSAVSFSSFSSFQSRRCSCCLPSRSFNLPSVSISLCTLTDRLPPHCFVPLALPGEVSLPYQLSITLLLYLPLFISLPSLLLLLLHTSSYCSDFKSQRVMEGLIGAKADVTFWCHCWARSPFEKCQTVVCESSY